MSYPEWINAEVEKPEERINVLGKWAEVLNGKIVTYVNNPHVCYYYKNEWILSFNCKTRLTITYWMHLPDTVLKKKVSTVEPSKDLRSQGLKETLTDKGATPFTGAGLIDMTDLEYLKEQYPDKEVCKLINVNGVLQFRYKPYSGGAPHVQAMSHVRFFKYVYLIDGSLRVSRKPIKKPYFLPIAALFNK